MKGYIIENRDGLFYIGHCGKFSKDITKARIFKSPKTAIRHYWSENEYDDLKLLEITIDVSKCGLTITDELFETYNNYNYLYDYKDRKRKNDN